MTVLTGSDGALRFNGTIVAKVRSWTMTVNKDALETTHLGLFDREYIQGLRGATGSADVLYDETDIGTKALLNNVFRLDRTPVDNVEFILNSTRLTTIKATCFVNSMTPTVSVGAVQAATVSFQVSGAIEGAL